MEPPWEHPDWYDLHDDAWSAGLAREPEHYRELLLALPPLDRDAHLVDVGAGTGKLVGLIAQGYPMLGRVTLIEPNTPKLQRAQQRVEAALPRARVEAWASALGEGRTLPIAMADVVVVGSVLMPIMTLRGGALEAGLVWLRAALGELHVLARPGGEIFLLETLRAPWDRGGLRDPVRRLSLLELREEVLRAGFVEVECMYRFRDRVVLRARRPEAARVEVFVPGDDPERLLPIEVMRAMGLPSFGPPPTAEVPAAPATVVDAPPEAPAHDDVPPATDEALRDQTSLATLILPAISRATPTREDEEG